MRLFLPALAATLALLAASASAAPRCATSEARSDWL